MAKLSKHDGVCELGLVLLFDTYMPTDAAALSDWLDALTDGTTVVGISTDEGSKYIDAALTSFAALGVDLSTFRSRYRMAFVAYVGHPGDTEMFVMPPGSPAILSTILKGELMNRKHHT